MKGQNTDLSVENEKFPNEVIHRENADEHHRFNFKTFS